MPIWFPKFLSLSWTDKERFEVQAYSTDDTKFWYW